MNGPPRAPLRPWAVPFLLSGTVHAAVLGGAMVLVGLVEPPRPEPIIPVELVVAAPSLSSLSGSESAADEAASAPPAPAEPPAQVARPAPSPVPAPEAHPAPPVKKATFGAPDVPPLPRRKPKPPPDPAATAALARGAVIKAPSLAPPHPSVLPKPEAKETEGAGADAGAPSTAPAAPPATVGAEGVDVADGLAPSTAPAAPPATPATARAASAARLVPPGWGAPWLANAPPVYPLAARRQGLEGRVVLRVRVAADGRAEGVTVVTSSGYALLDEAARRAVSRWRFVPGQLAGVSVAASVDVPVTFRLKD